MASKSAKGKPHGSRCEPDLPAVCGRSAGEKVPICTQRTMSSGVGIPVKPPMSCDQDQATFAAVAVKYTW